MRHGVAKASSHGAPGRDQSMIQWNQSLLARGVQQVDIGENIIFTHHHTIVAASHERKNGVVAKVRGQNSISRDGRTAALNVAKHRGAGFHIAVFLNVFSHKRANAAKANGVGTCGINARHHLLA